ncbi:MAG: glycine cleavage system protein T [Chloroflexi bacterium HGW-Chloroflexi-2]|jgi:glycine hydroxymethyltransferase|nr:MAG: glycine cleavage system protein T [Chloroflexi bacterium HGW-Chloroflexi-2]
MADFLFSGKLSELDPDVSELIKIEAERQNRKLILIPSESTAPAAVRDALGSVFQNIYAEGYPDERMRLMSEDEILDYDEQLAYYRRYSDPRYYKGVEYADIIESLAARRCAEVFAANGVSPDNLYVNVQPLSGAPANNAVYHLINPGDTIMGMNLLHGGHLTHGSSVNRSGKLFNVVHYTVDPETEQINYDQVAALATEHKPKIIIAGYSSYPFVPDWRKFREIADSVGAYFLADVSHIAGLIAAGVIPSPVGFAHVISFTTHKTLCGPRGACIITDNASLAKKIDRGVFPGEQGGPHIHAIAALAATFKLAKTPEFKKLQEQIVKNCQVLTNHLEERGLRIPFNGTNTHLGNIDVSTIKGTDGTPLSGDLAARILDIAGLVMNRNTIPGDKSALKASGVRYGTPWMTQRGLDEIDMVLVADIIADVLFAVTPYTIDSRKGPVQRAKVDFKVLEEAKIRVRKLVEKAGVDPDISVHGYPHFYYLDELPKGIDGKIGYDLSGKGIRHFVNYVFSSDVESLKLGEEQLTYLYADGELINGVITYVSPDHFRFTTDITKGNLAATWMRDLSDAYIYFDKDLHRRLPGPIIIKESLVVSNLQIDNGDISVTKPYFIGHSNVKDELPTKPKFEWVEKESDELKRTSLYENHVKLGAKIIPFAGWEMPVWYTSVTEEHLATRQAAGLFDVSHMGVYQAEGPDAVTFLDSVCGNDIAALEIGESCYTHFLDTDANVIDDLLVYRRQKEVYLVVVNASNDDKDWTWLNAVKDGNVMVDSLRPGATVFGKNVVLRNLRDRSAGAEMRVDIALQGPKSRDILLALGVDTETRKRIMKLKRTELCEAIVGEFDLVVSRTGYTGEKMAFELFIHPDHAPAFWDALVKAGEPMGLKPCGLGARDSLRTEAGLPLYGHEMGGDLGLGVSEANFGSFVKTYKPWFIGRDAYLAREAKRKGIVIRFRFQEKGVRMAHNNDPVIDKKGKVIGVVTSCAIDSEGYLTGQAYIEEKSNEDGAVVYIYQGAPDNIGKLPNQLSQGDRVKLPSPAMIISRFAKL